MQNCNIIGDGNYLYKLIVWFLVINHDFDIDFELKSEPHSKVKW